MSLAQFACLQFLWALPAYVFVFPVAVSTARVRFRVCRCCTHCPQVFMFASAVCVAGLSFAFAGGVCAAFVGYRGCKCCVHFPLWFSWSQVLYTQPSHWVRRISKFPYACLRKCCIQFTRSCSAFRNYSPFIWKWLHFLISSFWDRYVTVDQLFTRSNLGA